MTTAWAKGAKVRGGGGSPRAFLVFFVLLVAACTEPAGGGPAPVDGVVMSFMAREGIPGGIVAARDARGRALLRVYGLADPATGRPVRPDTAFRLASLSKPITAAAVGVLVDRGALRLDDRLADLLPLPPPSDPRVSRITVRHLLEHRAGWDRQRDFDPLVDARRRREELGLGTPPDCGPVAFAMLARPLQADPGSTYAYSNLGYCFLELIVARRSGMSYADFVAREVLVPRGIGGLALGEAGFAAESLARPQGRGRVPLNQAELLLLGGAGGWVGTASGELAFVATEKPEGLGWRRRPTGRGSDLTHYGALDGTFTVALRLADGLSVVVLFNGRPNDDDGAFASLYGEVPFAVRQSLNVGRSTTFSVAEQPVEVAPPTQLVQMWEDHRVAVLKGLE